MPPYLRGAEDGVQCVLVGQIKARCRWVRGTSGRAGGKGCTSATGITPYASGGWNESKSVMGLVRRSRRCVVEDCMAVQRGHGDRVRVLRRFCVEAVRMSEYIEFKKLKMLEGAKTAVVMVLAKKHDNLVLGYIKWHGPWRQYTFRPQANTILNYGCLDDIARECLKMTRQHRAERMSLRGSSD
jgi:hypothetical protein